MKNLKEKNLASSIISNRFSGTGLAFSVANGHLIRIGDDYKRALGFANALVAGCEGIDVSKISMADFGSICEKILEHIPITQEKEIGKIDSYEKLAEQGFKIKIEPEEENPLPYSVKQQIKKIFTYGDIDLVNASLKDLKANNKISEANLLNMVDSIYTAYEWLVNTAQVKVDLHELTKTVYKKNKEKYKW